jgi:uncharacterized iron-regulated membrane protein
MMESIPPRLRSPLMMLVGGAAIDAAVIPAFGWESLLSLGPVTIVCAAGYYVWAGRDSDSAAMVRHQLDERQAYRQLKMQALLGRVMSAGVGVAYVAAIAAKVTLWPFAALLTLFVVTLLAGWVIYRERVTG